MPLLHPNTTMDSNPRNNDNNNSGDNDDVEQRKTIAETLQSHLDSLPTHRDKFVKVSMAMKTIQSRFEVKRLAFVKAREEMEKVHDELSLVHTVFVKTLADIAECESCRGNSRNCRENSQK